MRKVIIALICAVLILTVGCGSKSEKLKNNENEYYTLNLKINPDVCFQCGGAGQDFVTPGSGGPGWWETCSNCGGSGQVGQYVPGGCSQCNGTGVLPRENIVCTHCWGK